MKFLWSYFKKYRLESILAPLFKCLEACFDLAVPVIVAKIIDTGIATANKPYIISRFLLLLAMAVLGLVSSCVAQYFAAKAAIGTAAGLRQDLLCKIQTLSCGEVDAVGTSTLITRMTSDVNQVQNGLNMFLRLFMRSPFIVFGAMIMAFTINARLALIFVIAIAVLFFIVFGVMWLSNPLYKKVQQQLDGVTEATREDLNGVRVIRAFSREGEQKKRFAAQNERLLHAQLFVGRVAAIMNPLTYLIVNAVIIAVLWLGAGKIQNGVLLSGSIIALINYILQILVELVKLANLITQLGRSVASMNRVGQVLSLQSGMQFGGGSQPQAGAPAVQFNNVSFCYNGSAEPALQNISFTAQKGQTIGIIGGTGSGKTTLANLILRFYDATSGTVLVNGVPVQSLSKQQLEQAVSAVLQRPRLFSGTVKSNLQLAAPQATEQQMLWALRLAQAKDFVLKKGGLDAAVEQDGANFSGGQRQRLTIARTLLSGAKIIILDDSLSALDFATDAAVRRALKTLPKDVTVFFISQRVGSIAGADRILVLDDGALVGSGTHSALLQSCGVYREIFESQTKGAEA